MVNLARTALYTAIYGGYDEPKQLPPLDVPAILYTDSQTTAKLGAERGWVPRLSYEPRPIGQRTAPHAQMRHKWWKCHPLAVRDPGGEPLDVTLWIDGSMTPTVFDYGARCLAALGDADWAVTRHPWRDCIYTEAEYSAGLPRYADTRILEQARHYRLECEHPPGWGLVATGANARRHSSLTRIAADLWWVEMLDWTHQDQISLPVVMRLTEATRWNWDLPWGEWWHLVPHAAPPEPNGA